MCRTVIWFVALLCLWEAGQGGCPCSGEYVCFDGGCKKPSDGVATCGSNSDCAHSNHASCSGGVCVCSGKRMWSVYYNKCLYPNDDQTDEADEIEDCLDQARNGRYDWFWTGACYCKGSSWNPTYKRCGAPVGNNCNGNRDACVDDEHGTCSSGKCVCNSGYKWDGSNGICRPLNNGVKDCDATSRCYDRSERAACDGKCTCNSGAGYLSSTELCGWYNDNTHSCTGLSDCYDQDTNYAICVTKCTCKTHFGWSSSDLKCKPCNDDFTSCTSLADCLDERPDKARCATNCKCKSSYTWHTTDNKCLGNNDGSSSCGTKSDCYDHSNRAQCDNGNCICKQNYLWRNLKCLGKNDGSASCGSLDHCLDQSTTAADCDGTCICTENYLWSDGREKCCGKNKGTISCSTLNDCADNDPSKAICHNNLCKCLDHYSWGGIECLADNDDTIACTNLNQCKDQSSLGQCAGNCKCVTGSKWSTTKKFCLFPNDQTHDCQGDITNCADSRSAHALCSGTCKCKSSHEWSTSVAKCLAYNNGNIECGNVNDCFDQTSGAALCTTVCTCESTHLWDLSSKRCLAKNEGTITCGGIEDCVDQDTDRAECVTYCKCKSTHTWGDTKCLANNDEQTSCISSLQCLINNVVGGCSGTCKCYTGSKWDPVGKRCLYPNDNSYDCNGDISVCTDQKSGAAVCDGKCKCAAKHKWDPDSGKCLGYNDGTTSCSTVDDCIDQGTNTGECNTYCKCQEHYSWVEFECLIDNDEFTTCGETSDCFDHGSLGVCSGTCKCVEGSIWDGTLKYCLYPNNGNHDCTDDGLASCVDQRTDAAICSGECKCKASYSWSTDFAKCLGDNDGTTICGIVDDCLDNSNRATCDGNCKCKDHYTWVTNKCLADNDDTISCTDDAQCVDQTSVGTCSGNCKCIPGSVWSIADKRCLLPNNGGYTCGGITECVDQREDAAKCESKCKCKEFYEWSTASTKCLGYNNGNAICTTLDDCLHQDSPAAICDGGYCKCNTNRVWVYNKCLAKNNALVPCVSKTECLDDSSLGECAGTCKCIEGGLWNDSEGRCLAPNDGNHDCGGQLSNCADQRAQPATCNTKCDCNASYKWLASPNKCLGYNEGNTFCVTKDDCWDHSDRAVCDNGKCTCATGYMWSDVHKECLIPNDMSLACSNIDECFEQNTLKAVCSTKCGCATGYTWVVDKKTCLLENDGSHTCGSINECADQNSNRAECNNECKCKSSYKWSGTDKICLGYNDGIAECADIDECIDTRSTQTECNGKCLCKDPYKWIEADQFKCLAPNRGNVECNGDITLCIDQDTNRAECFTYCECKAGHLWSNEKNKCLIHNDENTDCTDLKDCVEQDPVAGVCDGKCKCMIHYSWYLDRKRCLAPNDGIATCNSISNCLDQNPDTTDCSAASNNKCACKSPYIWIDDSSLCLGPNDGTATCDTIADCVDQTVSRTECSGAGTKKCKCISPFLWHSTDLLCLPPNDETHTCSELADCYDQTLASATCSGTCDCKTNNQWSSGDKKCVCVPGTSSPSGYGGCTDCLEGHYQDQPGQTSCEVCAENTYNPNVRSTSVSACQACPSNSESSAGSKFCTCDTGYYSVVSNGIQLCPKCHSFCAECEGTATTCSVCKNLPGIYQQGDQCLCNVDDGFYVYYDSDNDEYECRKCHRLCKHCHGDTQQDCSLCRDYLPHVLPLSGSTCECELGYFDDPNENEPTRYCRQCGLFCVKCENLPDECSECVAQPGIVLVGDRCKCAAPGYFQFFNAQTNTEECVRCHPLCLNCDGPSSDQCNICDSSKGAIFLSPSTCKCQQHSYYDTDSDRCLECNELCQECTGPSSSECQGCNPSTGFSVVGHAGICVYSCDSFEGYFAQLRVCKRCHDTCLNCTDGSRSGCLNCQEELYLWRHTCISSCPEGTFTSEHICEPCQPPCENCISEEECTTCLEGFYKISNTTDCVKPSDCPTNTFPDSDARVCQKCYYTCLTCNGPTRRDCILCNFAKGFARSNGEVGECYMLICKDGEYLKIDYVAQKATCEDCHKTCKTCNGGGEEDCIECPKGREEIKRDEGINTVRCKTCSEIEAGYYTDGNGDCKEICGDGLSLGQVECDDGNRRNGDGCDSNCRVELGYKCFRRHNSPDYCIDVVAPQATLSVKKGNTLVIKFSEKVYSTVDSVKLAKSLEVTLEGTKEPCEIEWHLGKNFTSLANFEELVIRTTVTCHLRGQVEKFFVKFNHLEYLKDFANNSLDTELIHANSVRQLYISEGQKAAVSGAGSTFSSSSLLTFGLVLGMNLFQSAAVGSFWAFINMLQIVSYVPAISCVIPYNLEILLTEYLTVSKMVFPFSMLPNFFPNPLAWATDFLTDPFNDRFSLCGYESLSFIYNFSEQLLTWLILGVIYILLKILTSIFPKEK